MLKSLLTATAATALLTATAFAGDISLSVADYDIETVEGVDSLHREIILASEDVCSDYKSDPLYGGYRAYSKCTIKTVDTTVYSSEIEPLIAFHEALPVEERYDADRPTPSVELQDLAALVQ